MPQTLAEKLLAQRSNQTQVHAGQIVWCPVSLVLANDITAPLTIKSFEAMGATKVFEQSKVVLVCDHFTPNKDIDSAQQVKLVREFAKSKGIVHFYDGGESGVEHALLPELGLVGPGDVVVGADSHTCTYGGLGAFATGLGSTDVAGAMALGETWFKVPQSIRVEFFGDMPVHLEAKDLILLVIKTIGVAGATSKALEFSGSVIEAMDVEGRMTMANMAIEAGGKAGLFAADDKTLAYTRAAGRQGDQPIAPEAGAVYAQELRFDVSGLSPQVACPHLPENVKPVEEVQDVAVDQVVIGSCTNGRLSDLRRAAKILQGRKAAKGLRLIILPATPMIYKQALREGLLEIFMDAGAVIGPPTCGPCLGGHMGILASGEKVLATTNRNFKGRMGSLDSEVYLAGAGVAAATAVAGQICHPGKI